MHRRSLRLTTALAAVVAGLVGAGNGAAAVTATGCGTAHVDVQLTGQSDVWFYGDMFGSRDFFVSEVGACGTVDSTRLVTVHHVEDGWAPGRVYLKLNHGPFSGANGEIRFQIDVPATEVNVEGGPERNALVVGQAGINLNADTSASTDVVLVSMASLALRGGDGADLISFAGGRGTGAPFQPLLYQFTRAWGEGGDDWIIGANAGGLLLSGGGGNDWIFGGPRDDHLEGGAGHDHLYGGPGNDGLAPSNGHDDNDIAVGGAGRDRLLLNPATTLDVVEFDGPALVNLTAERTGGSVGVDSIQGFEDVEGTVFGDVLIGNDGPNLLVDGAGENGDNDWLDGRGGDDHLVSYGGNDMLDGGAGTDTCDLDAAIGAGSTMNCP